MEEVKLQAHKEAVGVFTDGSMHECGNAGEVWYVGAGGGWRRGVESKVGLGTAVTVWGAEVVGVNGGLRTAPSDRKILILSDSQVAISAVRKAGRTVRARAADLGGRWRKLEKGDQIP